VLNFEGSTAAAVAFVDRIRLYGMGRFGVNMTALANVAATTVRAGKCDERGSVRQMVA
jgi:hypothetical protein